MTGGSMRVWRAAALALALGLAARPLSAQTYQGGMRGVVKDVQGIAVSYTHLTLPTIYSV